MSKKSRRPNRRNRHRDPRLGFPSGSSAARVTDDELGTVQLILHLIHTTGGPLCPGPIVVHGTGVFECHGGCEGLRFASHDAHDIEPCNSARALLDGYSVNCARCVDVAVPGEHGWSPLAGT